MGWSGGTDIVSDMVPVLKATIRDEGNRKLVYKSLISTCQSLDWDTEYEVEGRDPALDEVLRELGLLSEE